MQRQSMRRHAELVLRVVIVLAAVAATSAATPTTDDGAVVSTNVRLVHVATASPVPAVVLENCTTDHAGRRSGCQPRAEAPDAESRVAVLSSYLVAAIRVEFSRQVTIEKNGTRCGPTDLGAECGRAALGLVRLVCGGRLYESHPSRVYGSDPPLFLLPWAAAAAHLPQVAMAIGPDLAPGPKDVAFVLVMSHEARESDGRAKITSNLDPDELERGCELRFLGASSQSWPPSSSLTLEPASDGDARLPFVGSLPITSASRGPVCDDDQQPPSSSTGATPPVTGGAESVAASESQTRTPAQVVALLRAERERLEREVAVDRAEADAVFLQSGTRVKFAGVVKGLVSGAVSPVGDAWGAVAGGFMAGAVVNPVADQLMKPLTESITSGVQPFLTAGLVTNILPSVTETVTDHVIDNLCNFLTDALTEHMTPLMVDRLTTRLKPDLIKPLSAALATDGAVKMATTVSTTVNRVLGKSVPHAIVGALTHTLTHSPMIDYYCYYCFHYQEYCKYCRDGHTPSQMYYTLYYTGYYSSYYSVYYASTSTIGVEMVREKKTDFEDPSAFGSKE